MGIRCYFCTFAAVNEGIMSNFKKESNAIYVVLVALLFVGLCLSFVPALSPYVGWITPPVALFAGLAFALCCGKAYPKFNKLMSKKLLQYSVVGLGFGMNVDAALESGSDGMLFTIVSVMGTLALGWVIGRRVLKVDTQTSYLVSAGTAICGGSAIAAVGPVIKAKESNMSVALGTIFILNAIALFIFPALGHVFGMSDRQFGMWAAIAIHDTSSVVGAGQAYSPQALEIATTIKLTRALWIIPVAMVTAVLFRGDTKKVSVPWFILWFIVAILFSTYVMQPMGWGVVGDVIKAISHKCLTLTLFFIGASLSVDVLKQVGVKPLLQGVLLWVVISAASLLYILTYID